jgi:hypothetical protein
MHFNSARKKIYTIFCKVPYLGLTCLTVLSQIMNWCPYSFFVALGSVLQDTTRQPAPGKCRSVFTLTSVTGNSSYGNISGAVCDKKLTHLLFTSHKTMIIRFIFFKVSFKLALERLDKTFNVKKHICYKKITWKHKQIWVVNSIR